MTLKRTISAVVFRGMSTRAFTQTTKLIITFDRYSKENFQNILALSDALGKIGAKHNATSGQIALAWLLAQGPDVIPIPGTTKIHVRIMIIMRFRPRTNRRARQSLKENVAATKITLTDEEVAEVRRISESAEAAKGGDRYPPGMAEQLFADTPAL